MKPLLAVLLLAISFQSRAQEEKPSTGFLILSLDRSESAFDLFFPCTIDAEKNLKQNILQAKAGTSFLAIMDEEELEALIPFSDTVKNEALASRITDDLEYLMVIPVEVIFGNNRKASFARNEKDVLLDWPVKFYNRLLFGSYNAKQVELKNIRLLKLQN